MQMTLEVVAVTVADALAAEAGGADRLELVAGFAEGGVTPSAGVIAAVRKATRLPIYVMIRPRGGDFVYSPAEVDAMAYDARLARELGADGLVLGALHLDGSVDVEAITRVLAAGQLPATFHRAIERTADQKAALDLLATIPGVERVLTSGGAGDPIAAIPLLRDLAAHQPQIAVMAGAGVTLANAEQIVRETGVRSLHTGSAVREPQTATAPVAEERVRALRRILDQI